MGGFIYVMINPSFCDSLWCGALTVSLKYF
jgi:hypothetical protein